MLKTHRVRNILKMDYDRNEAYIFTLKQAQVQIVELISKIENVLENKNDQMPLENQISLSQTNSKPIQKQKSSYKQRTSSSVFGYDNFCIFTKQATNQMIKSFRRIRKKWQTIIDL